MTAPVPSKCRARQYADSMSCVCGLSWDVNDPEPPECRRIEQQREAIREIRAALGQAKKRMEGRR